MKKNPPGAQFEILVDGKPQSYVARHHLMALAMRPTGLGRRLQGEHRLLCTAVFSARHPHRWRRCDP
jgi:hypothetical protein